MPGLILLLWCHVDPVTIRHVQVDVIELNRVFKQNAQTGVMEKTFEQWIFWEWNQLRSDFFVRDWRQLNKKQALPIFDHKRKMWFLTFKDRNTWIIITSISFLETWTDFDPEAENRKVHPVEWRRKL